MGRRLIASTFVLALAVISQCAWSLSASSAPLGGMAGLGQEALTHKPVAQAGYYHRRHRRPHIGFYTPHFSFYIGPRYRYRHYGYRHYAYRPYYYASPYRYYYKPRRHHRHWRHRHW